LLDCANRYLNKEEKENPLVAPVFANLSGFPPMLVQVGTCEVLLTQIRAFAEKAKSEKVEITYTEYEDMFHTFLISNPNVPQSELALEEIGRYLS
jgi:monoterpene epsilon-lactone hydrolase